MILKKAAMFDLCRACKKQSSELFLASRHSVDSQETRGSFKTNRAAMFGLDARIALAIFGALSVISGAALYSAIEDAKLTALYVEMQEIGKAMEQYYLDTGVEVASHRLSDLVEDPGLAGWKGPYVNYPVSSTAGHLKYEDFPNTVLLYNTRLKDDNFTASSGVNCTTSDPCYHYIAISQTAIDSSTVKLWEKLSAKFDGNSNLLTGNVRSFVQTVNRYYYIKQAPVIAR